MLNRAHRTSFGLAALAIAIGLGVAKAMLGGVERTVSWWTVCAMWVCLFKSLGY
jgi:hypothetical protein